MTGVTTIYVTGQSDVFVLVSVLVFVLFVVSAGEMARELLAVGADVADVDEAQVLALALVVVAVAIELHAAVHLLR